MSAPTLDQENALLGPGWTSEQLLEHWMAGAAAHLYRDGSTSLDAAAEFASVPKVWLLSMMANDKRPPRLSDENLGRDAGRYVSVDPEILSGTPCVKGTRVPAHYIADMAKNGDTVPEILAAYPYLTEGQVCAAVEYTRVFPHLARSQKQPPWRHQPPLSSWLGRNGAKGWREDSEQPISRADLAAIGDDAVDITCRVIEAVTANGIQFPGSKSPGEPAWPSQPEQS